MPDQEKEVSFKDLFIPLTTVKVIIFLFLIGIILFFNGLFNTFVADDPPEITENPVIHSIQNFPEFFKGGLFYMGPGQQLGGSFYRPLQSTYFSAIYTVFGPSSFMFHLFQVLLFIMNACLVFLLFKHFFEKRLAFMVSLVFLVHPINSESAYYISATQEVLFLLFGLISLFIIKKSQSQKALFFTALCLFCSLLSKESGILFFFVVPFYVFIYHRKKFFPFLAYVLSFLGGYFLLRISALGIIPPVTKNAPIQYLSLPERLSNVPEMFLFYIKTFFFPRDLSAVYHWVYKQIDFSHFFLPLIIDLLFLGGIFFFLFFIYKKSRKYFFRALFLIKEMPSLGLP